VRNDNGDNVAIAELADTDCLSYRITVNTLLITQLLITYLERTPGSVL